MAKNSSKKAPKEGKRFEAARSKAPDKPVPLDAAIALVKGFPAPKFDQTVEMIFWLGLDTTHADQQVRSSVSLPHGIGKSKRVVAFVDPTRAQACLEAGAMMAGGEEMIKEIENANFTDFDTAIATPDMMRFVGKLGKMLGPKGLMPAPKAGTVTPNIEDAVKEYAAGKQEFRTDKGANVHTVIGKASFDSEQLKENAQAMLDKIKSVKPEAAKTVYLKKVTLKATMTPGVEVAVSD
ncbi:MAG: 50S ribosomal protein L1 [Planctomycetota bacterium]